MATNFINASYIRSNTDIGVNYNASDLFNAVKDYQELELVPVIGRTLYDSLQGHVEENLTNQTPIPSAYNTLLNDYIAPAVAWGAYYNVIETTYLKPRATGLGQGAVGGNTPSTPAQYQSKRDSVRPKIDHYITRLSQYIDDQGSSVFTELSTSEDLPIDRRQELTSTSSQLMTRRNANGTPARTKFGRGIL